MVAHCGRNTHFRRICLTVPNFNFKYIYIKFEELRDNWRNFRRNKAKNWQGEKITQVKISNAPFFYYSSSNVNCHSIQVTIKIVYK